jgi:hypothetical protein
MDYAFLRHEGVKYIERMAGQVWTDFNAHDPGITILEQICYAITDLGYRVSHAIPDLLTQGGNSTYESLYGPAHVLTTRPVTLNDLRRVVIDVPGVKNAWVEKVDKTLFYDANQKTLQLRAPTDSQNPPGNPVSLKGLYRVLVELADLQYIGETTVDSERPAAVLARVASRLHENRGLCEDFEYPVELQPQNVQVTASIEIGPVDDAESLLLEIYQRIADYISPSIPFYTFSELLDAGKGVDEIYEGPLLDHGFVDSATLEQGRRTALRTSDLINIMMNVPGVRVVKALKISVDGGKAQSWSVDLDLKRAAKLDLNGSKIQLERHGVVVSSVISERAKTAYVNVLRSAANGRSMAHEEPLPPSGQDRNVGRYYSMQHQFPAAYGIGGMGLPDSATAERKVQAKQLKAYLLFFDQLLANYFAQLAHARDLFSFSADGTSTYFAQVIDDPSLGLDDILKPDSTDQQEWLQELTDPLPIDGSPDSQYMRRNRFLNHLLARFGEQFTDYSLVLYGAMTDHDTSAAQKLIQDKQAFLKDYPRMGGARGTAFNYQQPWSVENSSGLEQRLRRKLGLADDEAGAFYLIEHILLRPMEGDEKQLIPILANAQVRDPYSLQISFVFAADLPRFQKTAFRGFIERTIREETPAHLVPYIRWFDRDTMTAFEAAYREWFDTRRAYVTGA